MLTKRPGFVSILLLFGAACEPAPRLTEGVQVSMSDDGFGEALGAIARARLYFGHQSVGENLLHGLATLAREAGTEFPIDELDGPGRASAAIVHSRLGKNGEPAGKIDAFQQVLSRPELRGVRFAAMKLCYADFHSGSDVEALFARYATALDRIGAEHPDLTLLHVTTPLTARGEGPRHRLQRMLGMAPGGDRANVQRHRYNEQLRARYAGPTLFDLARLEATAPDGGLRMYGPTSAPYPALVAAYTDDGGHLNDSGQRHVAAAFIRWLAALTR